MTTKERIEENANLIKWCVHTIGPDDVFAAPCYSAAETQARVWNQQLHRTSKFSDILCFNYAAPWPHNDKNHAVYLKEWEKTIGLKPAKSKP